ncbi:AAA family ATPase [Thermomicrobium sp. 4228-Ro]|uniref:AAA family ATPase n=1 Tax=Thermomicrobium sp. 4228-Ro TaxID=2993937 RepID=UPI00224971D5|nr:AAA family ATPase [Thermomicrobium sp. 4228-Ro]MCX2726680.1 AAA family ATPase [Thermomicrobium sp. 4228-Ro]
MAADRLSDELIRRIREDEAFRRQLLDVLLGEEFLHLPPTVHRIQEALERLIGTLEGERQAAAERQRRIDEQIERLGQRIDALATRVEAQIEALTQRMDRVEAQIEALTVRMERVEAQIEALTVRMERVEAQIEALTQRIDDLTVRMERVEAQIEALTVRMERVEAQIAALTQRVDDLTVRMERVEAQIEALTQRMERVEAQIEALTQRMERVEAQIEALTQRMERVEAQIAALTQRMERVEAQIAELTQELRFVRSRLDEYVGITLELRYHQRASAIFGRFLRRVRPGTAGDVSDQLVELLTEREAEEAFAIDLLVRGVPRSMPELGEVWIAIEVSSVVDRYDVERALRRAAILRRVHPRVLPAVAGERLTEGAGELAGNEAVLVVQDGRVSGWEDAAARWLARRHGETSG